MKRPDIWIFHHDEFFDENDLRDFIQRLDKARERKRAGKLDQHVADLERAMSVAGSYGSASAMLEALLAGYMAQGWNAEWIEYRLEEMADRVKSRRVRARLRRSSEFRIIDRWRQPAQSRGRLIKKGE